MTTSEDPKRGAGAPTAARDNPPDAESVLTSPNASDASDDSSDANARPEAPAGRDQRVEPSNPTKRPAGKGKRKTSGKRLQKQARSKASKKPPPGASKRSKSPSVAERLLARLGWQPRLPPEVRRLLTPDVYFVASFLALNATFNVRAPANEPFAWYLLPSLDVVVLLGLFALAGIFGLRVHRWVLSGAVAFALFARIYRLSDGVVARMYNRDVNAFVDVPMLPELARLMWSTLSLVRLVLVVALALGGLVFLAWINYRAMRFAAYYLRVPRHRIKFGAVVALFGLASLLPLRMPSPELFDGAFASSLVPRLAADYRGFQRSSEVAAGIVEKAKANREVFASGAWNLRQLNGTNVYLLFFESYGETLVARDVYKPEIFKEYARIEQALGSRGFNFASTIYDSPTVGGYSWFAHSTLESGIKVTDQKQFLALKSAGPPTIVHAFKKAGYMTTTVNPATMRWPKGPDLYGFETHFYSWEFGYRGVNFSWAPMPDQFALDYVRRNHIDKLDRPLFLEYGMVSSHAPWNDQAPLIEDWDQIGDGSIYRTLEHVRYPTTWDNLETAELPYLRSVIYVLEVLLRYIHAYVHDDSLFIIVGDHQPVGEITAHTESRGSIMHVISRNPAFVDKFVRRGFARGMRPKSPTPRLGMEAFLAGFMEDFSSKE